MFVVTGEYSLRFQVFVVDRCVFDEYRCGWTGVCL